MGSALRTIRRGGKPNPPRKLPTFSGLGHGLVPNKAARLLRATLIGNSRWPQIIKQSTADRWGKKRQSSHNVFISG